eukprot:Gregarina_sp_Poly_1__3724@NODE_20_length_21312_cov_69_583714_g18_i0_p1_GENE_NODE_20_length_21312_cov_69_583714_g18_i0NODE_20_length_21312_cov_69_583714_g18_i0_p1_ORF_typecomplete_len3277_score493_10Ribonuclease_3/PF00636_26/1_3e14Ribonuclease_3/PF00636_26/2_6e13Ribonucleas_3_3/PF14622_6/3_4e11Ribonucleas_3_3/PF14622_6/1_3e06ResIII/PF04851_15/7_1e15Helicase_C/PF00271_31/4_7e12DEAD/PF00270_29/0_00033DEAD/PF00270_29/0_00056ERCC3_RAD25_C/PF16203_5/0_23ERCC3_RAD25_C/PF16203_5/6_7e03Abhydrolase_1/PF00
MTSHESSSNLRVREYQKVIYEHAKRQNTIAILPTNSGKTLIASQLAYHYLSLPIYFDKIVVFLTPTIILAKQQRRALSRDFLGLTNLSAIDTSETVITYQLPKSEDKIGSTDPDDYEPCPEWTAQVESRVFAGNRGALDAHVGITWNHSTSWQELFADLKEYKDAVEESFRKKLVPPTNLFPERTQLVEKGIRPFSVEAAKNKEASVTDNDLDDNELLEKEAEYENEVARDDGPENEVTGWPRLFVMPPDKFLLFLQHGTINMSNISLLVIDECHHCFEGSPYRIIMNEYYHIAAVLQQTEGDTIDYDKRFDRPRILGLTASPIKKKIDLRAASMFTNESMVSKIQEELTQLCRTYDAGIHIGQLPGKDRDSCWLQHKPIDRPVSFISYAYFYQWRSVLHIAVVSPITRLVREHWHVSMPAETAEQLLDYKPSSDLNAVKSRLLSEESEIDPLWFMLHSPNRTDAQKMDFNQILTIISGYQKLILMLEEVQTVAAGLPELVKGEISNSQKTSSDSTQGAAGRSREQDSTDAVAFNAEKQDLKLISERQKRQLKELEEQLAHRSRVFLVIQKTLETLTQELAHIQGRDVLARWQTPSLNMKREDEHVWTQWNGRFEQVLNETGLWGFHEFIADWYTTCGKVLHAHSDPHERLERIFTMASRFAPGTLDTLDESLDREQHRYELCDLLAPTKLLTEDGVSSEFQFLRLPNLQGNRDLLRAMIIEHRVRQRRLRMESEMLNAAVRRAATMDDLDLPVETSLDTFWEPADPLVHICRDATDHETSIAIANLAEHADKRLRLLLEILDMCRKVCLGSSRSLAKTMGMEAPELHERNLVQLLRQLPTYLRRAKTCRQAAQKQACLLLYEAFLSRHPGVVRRLLQIGVVSPGAVLLHKEGFVPLKRPDWFNQYVPDKVTQVETILRKLAWDTAMHDTESLSYTEDLFAAVTYESWLGETWLHDVQINRPQFHAIAPENEDSDFEMPFEGSESSSSESVATTEDEDVRDDLQLMDNETSRFSRPLLRPKTSYYPSTRDPFETTASLSTTRYSTVRDSKRENFERDYNFRYNADLIRESKLDWNRDKERNSYRTETSYGDDRRYRDYELGEYKDVTWRKVDGGADYGHDSRSKNRRYEDETMDRRKLHRDDDRYGDNPHESRFEDRHERRRNRDYEDKTRLRRSSDATFSIDSNHSSENFAERDTATRTPHPGSQHRFLYSERHGREMPSDFETDRSRTIERNEIFSQRVLRKRLVSHSLLFTPKDLPNVAPVTLLSVGMKVLVFCDTRLKCWLISRYLETRIASRVGWITGVNSTQTTSEIYSSSGSQRTHKVESAVKSPTQDEQKLRVERFCGQPDNFSTIQVMVATTVIEEGFDLPECNAVVRFDLPSTLAQHIQSRGRARKQGSQYFVLGDVNSFEAVAHLKGFEALESLVIRCCEAFKNPPRPPALGKDSAPQKEDVIQQIRRHNIYDEISGVYVPLSLATRVYHDILRILAAGVQGGMLEDLSSSRTPEGLTNARQTRGNPREPELRKWLMTKGAHSTHKAELSFLRNSSTALVLPPAKGFRDTTLPIQIIKLPQGETLSRGVRRNLLALKALMIWKETGVLDDHYLPPMPAPPEISLGSHRKTKKDLGLQNVEWLWREAPWTFGLPNSILFRVSDLLREDFCLVLALGHTVLETLETDVLESRRLLLEGSTAIKGVRLHDHQALRSITEAVNEMLNETPLSSSRVESNANSFTNGHSEDPEKTETAERATPTHSSDVSAKAAEPTVPESAPDPSAQVTENSPTPAGSHANPLKTPSEKGASRETPQKTGNTMILYPHHIICRATSWNAEILKSGGLFGFWKLHHQPDESQRNEPPPKMVEFAETTIEWLRTNEESEEVEAMDAEDKTDEDETVNLVIDEDGNEVEGEVPQALEERANAAVEALKSLMEELELRKMAKRLGSRIMAKMEDEKAKVHERANESLVECSCCQYPGIRLIESHDPLSVLQPAVILLKSPLPKPINITISHSATGEKIYVTVRPISVQYLDKTNWIASRRADSPKKLEVLENIIKIQSQKGLVGEFSLESEQLKEWTQPIAYQLPSSLVLLLIRLRQDMSRLWAIKNFNFPGNSILRGVHSEESRRLLAQADARKSLLIHPFVCFAPLAPDGVSIDLGYVLRIHYMYAWTRSGNIRDTYTASHMEKIGEVTPPSLLEMYEKCPQLIDKLDPSHVHRVVSTDTSGTGPTHGKEKWSLTHLYCRHGRQKSRRRHDVVATFVGHTETLKTKAAFICQEEFEPAVFLFMESRPTPLKSRIPSEPQVTLLYGLSAELLAEVNRIRDRRYRGELLKHQDLETKALSIVYHSLLRGSESPIFRMTYQRSCNFHFYRITGYGWGHRPETTLMRIAQKDLASFYIDDFDQSVSDKNTFIFYGDKVRQGPRLAIIEELHPRKDNCHAPQFVNVLPISEPCAQLLSWMPALYWKLEVALKHLECKLLLDFSFSRRVPRRRTFEKKLEEGDEGLHTCWRWETRSTRTNRPLLTLVAPQNADFNIDYQLVRNALTTATGVAFRDLEWNELQAKIAVFDLWRGRFQNAEAAKAIFSLGIAAISDYQASGEKSSNRRILSPDTARLLNQLFQLIQEEFDDHPIERAIASIFRRKLPPSPLKSLSPYAAFEYFPSPQLRIQHNQVLEFVGDAVLKYVAGVWAFFALPESNEGEMSAESQKLKTNKALKAGVRAHRLHSFLLSRQFTTKGAESTLADLRAQRVSFKQQADVMEALLGAVYWSHYHRLDLWPGLSDLFFIEIASNWLDEKDDIDRNITVDELGALGKPFFLGSDWCGSSAGCFACAFLIEAYVMAAETRRTQSIVQIFSLLRDLSSADLLHPKSDNAARVRETFKPYPRPVMDTPVADMSHRRKVTVSVTHSDSNIYTNYDIKASWPNGLLTQDPLNIDFDDEAHQNPEIYRNVIAYFPSTMGLIHSQWVPKCYDGGLKEPARRFCELRQIPYRVSNADFLDAWFSNTPHKTAVREEVRELVSSARLHPSVQGTDLNQLPDFQRLEFLGDSALALLLTEWLQKAFPDAREGPLSYARAILQSNRFLCRAMCRKLLRQHRATIHDDSTVPATLDDFAAEDRIQEVPCERRIRPSRLLFYKVTPESKTKWMDLDDLQMRLMQEDTHSTDFEACREELSQEDLERLAKHGMDGKKNAGETLEGENVNFGRYKDLADVYESMVAVTLFEYRFDLRAVWEVIKGDFLPNEAALTEAINDDTFLIDAKGNVRAETSLEIKRRIERAKDQLRTQGAGI